MTWQGGRQLASMQKDGTTISFSYNDAGLRTEKTVNGSTRRYIWNSTQLMADVSASDAFYFHYSSGGELIGFTYKTADAETECILVKNQQGDVERVISADGTILASLHLRRLGQHAHRRRYPRPAKPHPLPGLLLRHRNKPLLSPEPLL